MLRKPLILLSLTLSLSACETFSTSPSSSPIKPVVITKADIEKQNVALTPAVLAKVDVIKENMMEEQPKMAAIIKTDITEHKLKLEPVVIDNIWARLRQGMALPDIDNPRIKAQRDWFIKHPEYLQRVMLRAKPLLHYILNEIDERGLPTEYALLPIVESAYQTYAYSHGRASGIWQIIPSTGRYLGLKQNWWYDGRRDLFLSSKAALKYLDMLEKQFNGNSVLALASYNAGPGKIRRAIRYNKNKKRPTDFWNLTEIRQETRNYVPKLYALKQIFSNPEKYGITLVDIADEPGFDVVHIEKQIDIAKAAELADMTLDDFYLLNPAFNHWATPPTGKHPLLLPIGKKALFNKNYAQLPASEHINWVRHKIKNGETLSQIATNYNTRVNLIQSVNNIKKSQIRAGKHLMIPTSTQSLKNYGQSNAARLAKTQNKVRGKSKTSHTVKKGDSLWTISRKHGVSHKSLAKWNGMAPIDTLKLGRQLVIWNSKTSKTTSTAPSFASLNRSNKTIQKLRYTVRKGDSVARIASKFKVKIADIKKWNKIGKYIQPGQSIKLWVDVTTQSI